MFLRSAFCDPRVHLTLENVERYGALAEDDIVKLTNVEARAQLTLAVGAQLADFELTHLVTKRLARPHDVAIDFDDDVLIGLGGVGAEEVEGLIARPAHRVQARVNHEPDRTPHLVSELTELRVRIFV